MTQAGALMQCSKMSGEERWASTGSIGVMQASSRAHTDYSHSVQRAYQFDLQSGNLISRRILRFISFLHSHCSDWVSSPFNLIKSLELGLIPIGRSNGRGAQLRLQQRCMSSAVGQRWLHRIRGASPVAYTHFPGLQQRSPGPFTVESVDLGSIPFD